MYISIIVTLSRAENITLVMQQLEKIIGGDIYELVFAIDNRKISKFQVERMIEQIGFRFKNVTVFNTGRSVPSKLSVPSRRDRIAQTMNEIKANIGGSSFVFGFEDDTILPDKVIDSLMSRYASLDNVGYIEGVQVGRWGIPYIGAFEADDIHKPTKFLTEKFKDKGYSQIDGGGFYCFLTPTKLFKSVEHKWAEPIGPDVNYGLELRKQGFKCIIDWDLKCGHVTPKKTLYPSSNCCQVELYLDKNKWNHSVIIEEPQNV